MTTITNTRAQKNGEYGVNGEFYHGGQFLPSSANTIKGEMGGNGNTTRKATKQEIAPQKWETSEKISIWSSLSLVCKFVGQTTYSKETGKIGRIELVGTYKNSIHFQDLAERWMNGERWM